MARRTLNRKELRAASDAAERREKDKEEEKEEDEEEEEEDAEDAADEESEEDEGGDEGEDEDEPVRKKPAKTKPVKVAKPRKSRAAKITRMKVVWGVFNNSNQRVAAFEYPKRADADALAAKLTADKKNTHFVQPVKEPIEEKKEASKKE